MSKIKFFWTTLHYIIRRNLIEWMLRLGTSEMGIHLSKHADIVLKNQYKKRNKSLYVIIAKVSITRNKAKFVIPSPKNVDSDADYNFVSTHIKFSLRSRWDPYRRISGVSKWDLGNLLTTSSQREKIRIARKIRINPIMIIGLI